MIIKSQKPSLEKGQAMMTAVIFFIVITLTIIIGLSASVAAEVRVATDTFKSRQSYFLAEAGVEDVVHRYKSGLEVSSTDETLTINGETVTTSIVSTSDGRVITSTGDLDDRIRKIQTTLLIGEGVAFSYAIQVGTGGFTLENNASVIGSVYSNGNISGASGAAITGGATAVGTINRVIIGTGTVGDAWSGTITNSTVRGNLYCQTGSSNNKACNTTRANPTVQDFPITEEIINGWKEDAQNGGVFTGTKTISGAVTSLGPIKINGDLVVNGGAELILTGTVWVTGNVDLGTNSSVHLDPSYGGSSGVLVTDGRVAISNNAGFAGSGSPGSLFMVLTTSDCPASSSCGSQNAISVSNNGGAVVLNAQNGTIRFNNNANAQHISAKQFYLSNNAALEYESGLIDTYFSGGPSGGWEIQGWTEVE